VTSTAPESAALALNSTCDLNCGVTFQNLLIAYEEGLVTEEAVREAAVRVLSARYALGMFDKDCPYPEIPFDVVDCEEHNRASLESSRRSKVLLKNNGILPLDIGKYKKIAVIGPTADSREILRGNYAGTSSRWVTILDGLRKELPDDARLFYAMGSHLFADRVEPLALPDDRLAEAYCIAAEADAVILCLGLDATVEGEQGDTGNSEAGGDKLDLHLPDCQRRLLDTVLETGKPVILVISGGSPFDLSDPHERCDAVIMDWYGGGMGGQATAELILGRYCPSGRLPISFPRDTGDLPPFEDYDMSGRTYRYAEKEPLYPFGYGLSYSTFSYRDFELSSYSLCSGESLNISVTVENKGKMDANEVVQVYIRNEDSPCRTPHWALCGFERIALPAGQSKKVEIVVSSRAFTSVSEDGVRENKPGSFTLYVGGYQPDTRSRSLTGSVCLSKTGCACPADGHLHIM
jgi:beta-glucosidase